MSYSRENPCTANAKEIYKYFKNHGWSNNAIYALLGNIQYESDGIIPTRGEYGGGGYGLVQWTPKSKLTNWAGAQKPPLDAAKLSTQCTRIQYECANEAQWTKKKAYNNMTFKQFSKSTERVEDLTKAFLVCYENPKDPSASQSDRIEYANDWKEYFED